MRTNIAQWPRAKSVGAATASLAHDRPRRKQVRLAEQRACRNTGNKSEDLRGRTDTYLQTPRRRHLSISVFIASHCEWVTYGKRALSAASAHTVKRCKNATRSGILATRNVVDTRTFSGGQSSLPVYDCRRSPAKTPGSIATQKQPARTDRSIFRPSESCGRSAFSGTRPEPLWALRAAPSRWQRSSPAFRPNSDAV